MSAGAALEPSASPRRPWSAACDRSSPSVGRAGRPSARSALRCTADPPPLPASRSASPRQYPERCAPSARAPDRRRSGSRCLAQSLCYPLPWWLLVSLALLNVSQRQLNQSGSHRPNLRKILYVIPLLELARRLRGEEIRRQPDHIEMAIGRDSFVLHLLQ